MKRRIRHLNSAKQIAPPTTTPALPPTIEEIRQRAHDIFMARGGTPGNELDDWLRAEQQLKQERAGTKVLSTSAPCFPGVEPVASDPRGPCWNATLDTRRSIQNRGEHE